MNSSTRKIGLAAGVCGLAGAALVLIGQPDAESRRGTGPHTALKRSAQAPPRPTTTAPPENKPSANPQELSPGHPRTNPVVGPARLDHLRALRQETRTRIENLRESSTEQDRIDLALEPQYLTSVIRQEFIPLIRECVTIAETDPKGKVLIHFEILGEEGVAGTVGDAHIVEEQSEFRHPEFEECVLNSLLAVEFAPPAHTGITSIDYPFEFG